MSEVDIAAGSRSRVPGRSLASRGFTGWSALAIALTLCACGARHTVDGPSDGGSDGSSGDTSVGDGGRDAWPGWEGGVPECEEDGDRRGDVVISISRDLWRIVGARRLRGSLTISSDTLDDLGGLECLEVVEGDLVIAGNRRLPSFRGLDALSVIGGTLTIGGPGRGDGNDVLGALVGLETLRSYEGLLVEGNPALRSLDGLEWVPMCSRGCSITVRNNPMLESLRTSEYWNANEFNGDVVIENDRSMEDLAPLFLNFIHRGDLVLRELPRLSDVCGLQGPEVIDGDLIVRGTGLESLGCLRDLVGLGGESLVIAENPNLPSCEAEGLRDSLMTLGWEGEAEIFGNGGDGTCP